MIARSLASPVHGIVRCTRDIDIVALLPPEHAESLAEELKREFYVERLFNLIHLASGFKIDIFPLTNDPFQRTQFGRRTTEVSFQFGEEPVEFPVATAEDTILNKLAWYRAGGDVSTQQWHDVRGVVEVKRDSLDFPYLRQWAGYLKVEDLLERVLSESGVRG